MHKISRVFIFTAFMVIKPCFGEMAQQVVIPGYNPAPSAPVSAPPISNPTTEGFIPPNSSIISTTVQTTVTPATIPAAPPPSPIKKEVPATEDELNDLIKSVNLKDWELMPSYLWTCTPSTFTVPMFNAKHDIKKEFANYAEDKKILTEKKATEIATLLGKPVTHQIVGLVADLCRVKISVSNVKKPYNLNCLFIILEVRTLSRLAALVAENNNKDEPLDIETYNAINNLIDTRCRKE